MKRDHVAAPHALHLSVPWITGPHFGIRQQPLATADCPGVSPDPLGQSEPRPVQCQELGLRGADSPRPVGPGVSSAWLQERVYPLLGERDSGDAARLRGRNPRGSRGHHLGLRTVRGLLRFRGFPPSILALNGHPPPLRAGNGAEQVEGTELSPLSPSPSLPLRGGKGP